MTRLSADTLSNLSIRHKIWAGFGGLLVLLVTVGIITYVSLNANERKVVNLVENIQPTVVASMQLVNQMDRASAALGFYLLSKEEVHKQDYIASLKNISKSIDALAANKLVTQSTEIQPLVIKVKEEIAQLQNYRDQMLEYAVNDAKNVPAMQFASVEVNPRVQNMMQWLQEILLYEEDEKATPQRKKFAIEVANLRHKLLSAVNELRLYMAFRQETQIANYISFRDLVAEDVKKLEKYDDTFLSFEQYDAMSKFRETFPLYFDAGEKLIKIHQADDWRKDAYVIRTELAPLTLAIQEKLNGIVDSQYQASRNDSRELANQVKNTQFIVIGLIGLGLISAIMVGLILTRAITVPIDKLRLSAGELAKGNLDQAIDTTRQDELGALAMSFADMRDSIRKKIADLRVLNNTGNELAILNTQITALQTALKVMGEQTNVKWGSVYLFNNDKEELEIKAYYPERKDDGHKAKSFRIGEGILGKAAQQRKVIYIPDTSREPDFVNSRDGVVEAKAIICVPMMDGDKVFGVMNFNGLSCDVRFEDADAEFAETISRMTVVALKNIQMLNVIEEQNQNLEHKVEERTAALHQKTNDINNMLQNMHQGIFTIDPAQAVHQEYSAYLEEILQTKQIAGEQVMDLLFTDTDLGSNALDQIKAALAAILGEDLMMYDFNKHCLVHEYVKTMPDSSSKILELDWDPIVFETDVVEKIMVTVRDVTEIRGLQAEAEQQKWELELIGQILQIAPQKFESFIKNAHDFIEQNEKAIESQTEPDAETIATLFRNMHTIKGNARTYGFESITDSAHEAENTYDKLRKNEITEWDKALLTRELSEVKRMIATYERIYKDKLSGNSGDGVYVDSDLVSKAREALDNVNFNNKKSLADGVTRIRSLVRAVGSETLDSVLEGMYKAMPELAERLGKAVPNIIINSHGIRFPQDSAPIFKNVMMHSFRNAMDHGIETVAERLAAGKPEAGTITLDAKQDGDILLFSLHDDGRGLALERIREKAIERGMIKSGQKVTDEFLGNLIFHSGLSTADKVTNISGRGVGMEAVSKFMNQLGGSVKIQFTGRAYGDQRYRPFVLHISLPANVYVKVA